MSLAADDFSETAEDMSVAPSEYAAAEPPPGSVPFPFTSPATPPNSGSILMTTLPPVVPAYSAAERMPLSNILSSAVQAITADTLDPSVSPYTASLEPPLALTVDPPAGTACHLPEMTTDSLQRAATATELADDWARAAAAWSAPVSYVSTPD